MDKMRQLDTGCECRNEPKNLLNESFLKSSAYRSVNIANKSTF